MGRINILWWRIARKYFCFIGKNNDTLIFLSQSGRKWQFRFTWVWLKANHFSIKTGTPVPLDWAHANPPSGPRNHERNCNLWVMSTDPWSRTKCESFTTDFAFHLRAYKRVQFPHKINIRRSPILKVYQIQIWCLHKEEVDNSIFSDDSEMNALCANTRNRWFVTISRDSVVPVLIESVLFEATLYQK